MVPRPRISVIIPTYHEEESIVDTITEVITRADDGCFEVIVADATPGCKTLAMMEDAGLTKRMATTLKALRAPKGRARQMDAGAAIARGEILLFLHSDTRLPRGWDGMLPQGPGWEYGCFIKRFDHPGLFYLLNAWWCDLRVRLGGFIVGDHALFIRREVFEAIGGFPKIALMEDIALSRLLGRRYRRLIVSTPVITSARRFEKNGRLRTWWLMQKMKLLYRLGTSPERLEKMYRSRTH